jgi:hypothetical protein
MILFRYVDARFPFLWETADQPPSRWAGEVPAAVNTLADTPDGAWAELLRHEEITDPEDLEGISATLWAVQVDPLPEARARLPGGVLTGGLESHERCRLHARRLHDRGHEGFIAPSAALLPGAAHGYRTDGGLTHGRARNGRVIVLFGRRPDITGWVACRDGRPDTGLLELTRHLGHPRD